MRPRTTPHEPIWECFRHAFAGVWQGLRAERNLRIHLVAGLIAAVVGLALRLNRWELAVLTLAIVFVIALELVNAAFEGVVDLVSPNRDPLAGYIKDVAAGAVLVATLGAVVVGALLLLPRLVAQLP